MHVPVLLKETVEALLKSNGKLYADCTLGGGGHTKYLLECNPQAVVVAIDRDESAIVRAKQVMADAVERKKLILIHGNFSDLKSLLSKHNVFHVDGIMVDLGFSSFQVDSAERGFSFSQSGPLDMRMDRAQELTAYTVVNNWPYAELIKVFFEYGEERHAKKIANKIIERREKEPFTNTKELADCIEACIKERGKIHPATRIFQAIRIAVNQELDSLSRLLENIPELLNPQGAFAAISFHSLEDRLVKTRLKYLTDACICPPESMRCSRCYNPPGWLLQKKPILASEAEIRDNPRARSAKLRVFYKNEKEAEK